MASLSALDLLAKSSPASVSTTDVPPAERELKEYLYVQDDVHLALVDELRQRRDSRESVIFLCGTSGDGKSELIRHIRPEFQYDYRFHVDATHSFHPEETALQALDHLFSTSAGRPTLVGINLGMLANFVNQAPDTHAALKKDIQDFFDGSRHGRNAHFVNFNDFPKIGIGKTSEIESPFIMTLLKRITSEAPENPIYRALAEDMKPGSARWKNFRLLGMPGIQRGVLRVLALCQLRNGVFLPNRTLLDLVHKLISGPRLLFDTLFTSDATEQLRAAASLDPAGRRTETTDRFLLAGRALAKNDEAQLFAKAITEATGISSLEVSPRGWLRLYYLLQDETIGNNFHQRFAAAFGEPGLARYCAAWVNHARYTDSSRQAVRVFCDETLRPAALSFANRIYPRLTPSRVYLGKRGQCVLSAPVHMKAAPDSISRPLQHSMAKFPIAYKPTVQSKVVNQEVSFRLFELLEKIRDGLRPHPHDKSTVVLLETLIENMVAAASQQEEMTLTPISAPGGPLSSAWRLRQDGDDIDAEPVA